MSFVAVPAVRPPGRRRRTRRSGLVPVLAAALLATGCGSAAPAVGDRAESSVTGPAPSVVESRSVVGSSRSAPVAGYPFSVQNCGSTVTVNAPPRRILTIKSTSLELLLALGVGDRVVGSAFLDGPVPEPWAAAAAKVPVLSDKAPAQEPVLELGPDLIVAGWESNLAADTAGTRQSLAAKGIASYVSPSACQGKYQPPKLTYPMVFDSFKEMGRLLGVPERADALVTEQTALLRTVTKAPAGTTALWWSSGNATPYVGAGIGAPQMVMDAVGLTNIAADIPQTWTSLGWEPIIAANPDVIVLVDASWNPAAKKIAALESNPATARMDAVVKHRFVTIPFPASEAGVRSVQAAVDIGTQVRDLGIG